jgi:hypothetical protein
MMVPNEKNVFDSKYVEDGNGTASSVEPRETASDEFDIDDKKYGIAKPRRIIIKGTILND